MPMTRDGIDDKFEPVTAADVTDEKLVAGEFRAFRRETRDFHESVAQSLKTFERVEAKLDVVIDMHNVLASRLDDIDKWRAATDVRLAALEKPVAQRDLKPSNRRKPARKKKK